MQNASRSPIHEAPAIPSYRSLYALTVLVAVLVIADVLFWWLGYEQLRSIWGWNLAMIAALAGGARIVYGALVALLEGDVGADLALAIATIAALILKEYWVAAEVVLIASVGESLEAITFSRTQKELRRIFELRPRTVHLRRGEQTVDVPAEDVQTGDVVVVRPGERIPVDGAVAIGRSAVDQSTLTGESVPVDKGPGDTVFAGTLNQFGALELTTEKVGHETTLGKIIEMVAQARRNKADVERTADRLARYFLPFVLTMALGTFVYTNLSAVQALATGQASDDVRWVWMPTLAVLVVACPCALVLATPAAMMAALAWMARRGVLATGGVALERLAHVQRFAFDKTGTLTEGKLQMGDCVVFGEASEDDVLRWAAAAEQPSEHLIARVIVAAADQRGLRTEPTEDFQALPGAGVRAQLVRSPGPPGTLLVGNRRLMVENDLPMPREVDEALAQIEQSGQTPLLVAVNRRIVGALGVRDTIRRDAAETVRQLRALGIDQIALLTGDHAAAARQVADAVGIERYAAELRPDEKANWLADWCGAEADRPHVAMVGDGVNDAPALATADVGLALGGVGSDIAAEAGDLILMGDPLAPLPGLVRLSRETVRIIRQNILVFAFGVNLVGIVFTGWIMPTWSEAWLARSPVAAALFHQVGSLLVLLNAMRLLWFERWDQGLWGRLESALGRRCGDLGRWLAPMGRAARWSWTLRGVWVRLAAVLLLAAYLSQVVVFVQTDEVALVRRFGRFHAILPPGAHLRLPPPWDQLTRERPRRVRTLSIGLRQIAAADVGATTESDVSRPIEWTTPHEGDLGTQAGEIAQILTGDQSLVELVGTVQYRVVDLERFRFAVREPDRVLAALAEGVVREVIAAQPLLSPDAEEDAPRELLSNGRGLTELQVRERLQARVDDLRLGIEILPEGVCLQDLHPPRAVVAAFRDVSSAFKEKERMRNEAQAYFRQRLIEAGGESAWRELSRVESVLTDVEWTQLWGQLHTQLAGEAASRLNAAQAFAAEQTNQAQGEAASFHLTVAAHGAEPRLTELRLYFETLDSAMPGKPKLILDPRHAGRRHLLLGVPAGTPPEMLPLYDSTEPIE